MLPNPGPLPSHVSPLTMLALVVVLVSTAWAQAQISRFCMGFPADCLSGLTLNAKGNLYGGTGGRWRSQRWHDLRADARRRHGWTLTTLHSFDGL